MPAYMRPFSFFRALTRNVSINDLESTVLMSPMLSGPCEMVVHQWRGYLNGMRKLDERFARFRKSQKAANNENEEARKVVVDEGMSESEVDDASSDAESDATSAGFVYSADDIKVDTIQIEELDVLDKFRKNPARGSQRHQIFESRCPSVVPHIVITTPEDDAEADAAFKARSPQPLIEQELGYLLPLIPYEAYSLMHGTYNAMECEPQVGGAQWTDADAGSEEASETQDEDEDSEGEDELDFGGHPDRPETPSKMEGSEGGYLPSLVADESDESDEDEDGPPDMATDPWFVKEMARQAALKLKAAAY